MTPLSSSEQDDYSSILPPLLKNLIRRGNPQSDNFGLPDLFLFPVAVPIHHFDDVIDIVGNAPQLGQTKSAGAILNRRRRARRVEGRMPGVISGARLKRLGWYS